MITFPAVLLAGVVCAPLYHLGHFYEGRQDAFSPDSVTGEMGILWQGSYLAHCFGGITWQGSRVWCVSCGPHDSHGYFSWQQRQVCPTAIAVTFWGKGDKKQLGSYSHDSDE